MTPTAMGRVGTSELHHRKQIEEKKGEREERACDRKKVMTLWC